MRISKADMKERDAFARNLFRRNKHLTVYDVDKRLKTFFGVGMNLLRLRLIRNRKNPDKYWAPTSDSAYRFGGVKVAYVKAEAEDKKLDITDMVRQLIRQELRSTLRAMIKSI